jgi:hypothetical protein
VDFSEPEDELRVASLTEIELGKAFGLQISLVVQRFIKFRKLSVETLT